jgi:nitrite reductase/ring-hydroxylating ferredoxin subunit
MPDPLAPVAHPPQPLCRSEDLAERGRGVAFDVVLWRQPARGFALRIDGAVVAYINRCSHVPTELDWNPGEFLDAQGQTIVCAVHGAQYSPTTGACLGGPCGRGRLMPVTVSEHGGQVHWYPSRDIAPVVFDVDGPGAADPAHTEPPTP